MMYRIALLLAAFSATALAQAPVVAPPTAPAPKDDLVPVTIDTSLGRIVVGLDRGRAPITTANFLHYVDTHRFDGETFYRAMHAYGGGLIQGAVGHDEAFALSLAIGISIVYSGFVLASGRQKALLVAKSHGE